MNSIAANSIKPWVALFFEAIPTIQAQMKKPDINLQVEIREEAAYISYETIKGGQEVFQLGLLERDAHAFWWD